MADAVTVFISVVLFLVLVRFLLFGSAPHNASQSSVNSGSGRTSRRRYPVSQDKVNTVLAMFPHFSREDIEDDLGMTGSVDETIDRILSGRVFPRRPVAPASSSSNSSGSVPSIIKPSKQTQELLKTKVEAEPERKWEESPEKRQMTLQQRKAFMVQQARKKFLEQQEKEK